ncbi:nucleotidyltransferase domain-containing protein [Patescibacteria group bacterium]|nr:nucleotidyltransferase domain-containing protein [Patescibacteria group bacterium]MBU4339108.1 nucleotidyltransferase domain-containing protein [Patescibacteria group bacterium]MBU4579724.1 nucleotidyltransferase domain-containing protein [Patescibacteria group bacterium]
MIKKSSIGKDRAVKSAVLSQNKNINVISKSFEAASFFSEENSKRIKEIAEKYDLELVLLFGSRVKGKFLHKESDFDVAYLSNKKLDLMEEARLIMELMPVFKSDKVDLVNIKLAHPLLLKQIFSNHEIIFCRNLSVYFQYKIYAERKYTEAEPLFRLRRVLIKNFLKKHAG